MSRQINTAAHGAQAVHARVFASIALIATVTIAPRPAFAQNASQLASEMPEPSATGRIEANGVSYYYEIRGEGEPLLLLHGGLGTLDMFDPIMPALAKDRKVIAVDLHGHGRTPLGDRTIRHADIGDDMAVVVKELGFVRVDVFGYSFGGGVALRLAVQHPEVVRRAAIVSAGFAQDGFHPEMLPQQAAVGADMAEMMMNTPMYQSYAAVAPNPDEFPELLDRMGEMMRQPYNWADDVKTLEMPVMLVFGDSDMYRPEHVVEFYKLLGGGLRDAGWNREHMSQNRLAILPGLTHYEMFLAPELVETVLPFLNGDSNAPVWSGPGGD